MIINDRKSNVFSPSFLGEVGKGRNSRKSFLQATMLLRNSVSFKLRFIEVVVPDEKKHKYLRKQGYGHPPFIAHRQEHSVDATFERFSKRVLTFF